MASPSLLQDAWAEGAKRDYPRDQMPKGSVWFSTDMLPNLDARLRERGGYTNASPDLAASLSTAAYVVGGIHAAYAAGATNIALDEDGQLFKFTAASATAVGASRIVVQNPVFHRDKVIVTASGGATAPQKVTNAAGVLTIAALGGSPPAATYATVFANRTVLARTSANTNRIWFSAINDPESYDTTNVYIDFVYPITGLAALQTAILIFHEAYTSRIRGFTPPSVAGGAGDFAVDDPKWTVGCTDARSIVYWNDQIIFANADGIYITDGAGLADLTKRCAMKRYWRDQMGSYDSSTYTIVGGIQSDHYVFTVMDGTTFKFSAAVDLYGNAWWPQTNLDARAMWEKQGAEDELYFGRRGAARVGALSDIFQPAAAVKNDGNGNAVVGTLETQFYQGKPNLKRFTDLYVLDYLADYAADNPTYTVGYILTPEDTSYTDLSPTLAENTTQTRRRLPVRQRGRGAAFKITRANAGDWQLSSLETDAHALEGSR